MGSIGRFEWLKSIWAVLAAFVLGTVIAVYVPALVAPLSKVGDLYVTFLIMCVPPIMLAALTSSLARLLTNKSAGDHLRRIAVVFLASMILTALVTGAFMLLVKPGQLSGEAKVMVGEMLVAGGDASADGPTGWGALLLGLVPENMFEAIAQGNYPQILFVSVLLGLLLGFVKAPASGRMLELVELVFEVFQQAVSWSAYVLPVALLGIVAGQVSSAGIEFLLSLARFIGVGIAASLTLSAFAAIALSTVLGVPWSVQWQAMRRPLTFGLATSSSMATMPLIMEGLEQLRLPPRLVRLIVPLNVLIGRQPAIISFMMVFLFTMQLYEIPVTGGSFATALFGSVFVGALTTGMPGVPSLTALTIVADPMGLPLTAVIPIMLAALPMFDPFITMAGAHMQAATTAIIIGEDRDEVETAANSGPQQTDAVAEPASGVASQVTGR